MLIILSPSKTLDETSAYPRVKHTQPALLSESSALIASLAKLKEKEIAALMDISPKLAALNHARFAAWHTPCTPANARAALYMFKGDVYDGLDAYRFDGDDVAFAQSHLRILSGLYGVLRPLDLMQPYRLEMGTTLTNARGKNLYHFWGDALSRELNKAAKASGSDLLINLASQEYAAAIDRATLTPRELVIHFKEKRGNKLQIIGLMAKRARGMMARHLITERVDDIKGITAFTAGGYRFEKTLSSGNELVFVR